MLMKSSALVLVTTLATTVTSEVNSWGQITTWNLQSQSYAFSVCSGTLSSMSFALREFDASAANASLDTEMTKAKTILTNFLTPRRQLKHGDIVGPIKTIGGEKISRNDILHQIMINEGPVAVAPVVASSQADEAKPDHTYRRLASTSAECSGHGHICGSNNMCHCDPGYIRGPGVQECVLLPVVEKCAEDDFTQIVFNIPTAGQYVLYTEVPLAEVQGSLQNPNARNAVLPFTKCLFGCETTLEQDDQSSKRRHLASGTKWLYTIIGSMIVCTTALVGILVLLLKKSMLMKMIDLMACFAAGTLLATVVLHLLPEASSYLKTEKSNVQGLSICAGVLVGIFVEQGLHMFLYAKGAGHGTCHGGAHLGGNDNDDCHKALTSPHIESGLTTRETKGFWDYAHVDAVAWIVAIGDFAHAFTDGILIAVAFSSENPTTGWLITMAICLHEVPHRIGDFFIFLKAGMSIGQACFVNFLASLSSLIGALVLLLVGDIAPAALGVILSIGGGVLLFLAMTELMPPMLQEMKPKAAAINMLFFIFGIAVIALSMANGGCSCGHAH